MHFGFSYVGLIFIFMLMIPNILWTKNQPKEYEKYAGNENKILGLLERIGEVLVSGLLLIFSDFNFHKLSWWCLWLFAALFFMILYEIYWIRYFRSEKTMKDFYSSILGIPVAGATLPVVASGFIAIYGKNPFLMIATVILGIGHIGIHLNHKKEADNIVESQQIEQFDFKYVPVLVERVSDLWTPPQAEESFRKLYAEGIIRQNMHDNKTQFQLVENNQLMAVAFTSKKGEKKSVEAWWKEQYEKLSDSQKISFDMCNEYLTLMDQKTLALMQNDDIKLDLFISTKKGWGKKILDVVLGDFKQSGYKNLYLWTDSECNVDWYIEHGYELLDEDVYEPFSSEEDYKTYIFRRKL